jgi:hypothetical protein
VAPPSTVITTLMAQAYGALVRNTFRSPLHLLHEMWSMLPDLIVKTQVNDRAYWWVANPAAPGDNLADRMNAPGRQQAFDSWHAAFMVDVVDMLESTAQHPGIDNLSKQVGRTFGSRAGQAVLSENQALTNSQRFSGRISVPTGGVGSAPLAVAPSATFASKPHTPFGRR